MIDSLFAHYHIVVISKEMINFVTRNEITNNNIIFKKYRNLILNIVTIYSGWYAKSTYNTNTFYRIANCQFVS